MNTRLALALAVSLGVALPAYSLTAIAATGQTAQQANPFFAESPLPLHYPQFDKIKDADFAPAFDAGMKQQLDEVQAIANNPAPPTFDNTLIALEKSGAILDRATTVFFSLIGADTNDARKQLQADYSARFAAHSDAINLNGKLFARIQTLYNNRAKLGLDAEGLRLVEKYHDNFVRAGAKLSDADKAKLKDMNAELARLGTKFSQNVLAEVNASYIVVDDARQLDGLSAEQIAAAAEAAKARKLDGKYVIALLNTTGQPALTNLTNRDLRRRIYEASVSRGSKGGEYDNTALVSRIMTLRAQKAALMGFANYAAYGLGNQTAKTPEAVNAMLGQLAPAAVANAKREAADLQAMIDAEQKAAGKPGFELQPWDWAFYSEKVRQAKYNFDESQLKPYFELKNVLENGVFFAAGKEFGLSFKQRTDLPVYHDDVTVYDVFDADGSQLAIFIFDPYARESKRGGAWMNAYVSQSGLTGDKPVVANHLNIPKPPAGKPTLLTWDEVTTTFHEFGHALHGMFSNVKYPYFSGTAVPRDFVEFPSQVNEMWADEPTILANYAKHYQNGSAMPQALLDKVIAASKFNQGFATTEYLGAAMLDQSWHQIGVDQVPAAQDVVKFEHEALVKDGIYYAPVPPRYRTTYFSHIMGGYSAGYYAYIWSEVLDANTQKWFRDNGGLSRANGDHFRKTLLSRGGSVDAMELFRNFAGHEPQIEPLLEKRGLTGAESK
ncbi:MAG: dipeptidyl carboxypeptidase II [Lysobacteraceae bacterium SCN 69-123]|uniref:M3 family metallopeptidase n=1 Tax=Stenotrophomonas acidaminiphila TaxID=128780 RepID=UPI00086D9C81|nr:M3 family metallopeptidase [Stenotrophomonas acidaminiphila]MBN8800831.1 M3 family metallopeptidase [Stenotrophomonas acidaminiphila]MDF9442644.1 M3 family peptidase [Stenotrophomonas acidaminiphila]ODU42367.1 MAG: dipeptidyl carboxypeptidase II [Xanthomonadaceae bacterium SCN 69-123]OJY80388.1 MAG: dipeptidyl carboxypeptidase II [Stenotrophomonas sp. 69-14]